MRRLGPEPLCDWRSRFRGVLERASRVSNDDLGVFPSPLLVYRVAITQLTIVLDKRMNEEEVRSMRGLGPGPLWGSKLQTGDLDMRAY